MDLPKDECARFEELIRKREEHTICVMSEDELKEFKDLCMKVLLSKNCSKEQKQHARLVYDLIESHQGLKY